jgi:hypothetical protein
MNPEISNEPYYSDNTSMEVYGVHRHCTAAHDTQNKKTYLLQPLNKRVACFVKTSPLYPDDYGRGFAPQHDTHGR